MRVARLSDVYAHYPLLDKSFEAFIQVRFGSRLISVISKMSKISC